MATPEQLLKRLEKSGGALEAAALREVLRAFRDIDTRALVAMLSAELLKANPRERLHAREYLQSLASSLYPALPAELLSLTQSGAVLGAQVGAGMLGELASPFVPAVVSEVAGELGGLLRANWGDAQKDFAAKTGKVITAALKTGGRYPVVSELKKQLGISRKGAQGLASDMLQTVLSMSADRVADTAGSELGLSIRIQWQAANDARVRKSHRELSGKIVEQGKTFKPGLILRYPRDLQCTDVGETRRCRCSALYLIDD